MSSEKTNKSFTKRLKLTRRGKVLGRKVGKNHFNAKAARTKQLGNKKMQDFNVTKKALSGFVPFGA